MWTKLRSIQQEGEANNKISVNRNLSQAIFQHISTNITILLGISICIKYLGFYNEKNYRLYVYFKYGIIFLGI